MRHPHKAVFVGAALAASLVFSGAAATQAAPAQSSVPGGPFASAFRVQNLTPGTDKADCAYTIYKDGGSIAFNTNLPPINPNDSAYVYTPDVQGFPSGTFSGVISCDQPVAAVVNFSDASKGDSYVGASNPAPTLFVPSAYRNYYNYSTSLRIQNTSASAQNVTVDYYASGSETPVAGASKTISIPANGAATVDQASVSQLAAGQAYSARISSSGGALAATVSIYGVPGTSIARQLYSFSAFPGGSNSPIYAPVIMRNFYGYNTTTTIQNVGNAEAEVELTYSNGTVKTFKVPANTSQVVFDFNEPTLQQNVLYSSKIKSLNGQPLIVTVNESNRYSRASTYEGVTTGGKTLVAPIVMKRYSGYNSSVTCQNLSTTASTNVRVSYSGTEIEDKLVLSLEPDQSGPIYQSKEQDLSNGYLGSATISADQNIVCVVNQDKDEGTAKTQVMDQLYAYVAIVKP
jgi:hypothetical protein